MTKELTAVRLMDAVGVESANLRKMLHDPRTPAQAMEDLRVARFMLGVTAERLSYRCVAGAQASLVSAREFMKLAEMKGLQAESAT